MTAPPDHNPPDHNLLNRSLLDRHRPADLIVTFTPKGEQALDDLAGAIVNRMSRTPTGLATTLDMVFHTPVAELVEAFTQIADQLNARQSRQPGQPTASPPPTALGDGR